MDVVFTINFVSYEQMLSLYIHISDLILLSWSMTASVNFKLLLEHIIYNLFWGTNFKPQWSLSRALSVVDYVVVYLINNLMSL